MRRSPAAPGMRSSLASPDLRYSAADQVDGTRRRVRTGSLRVTISAAVSDGYGPLERWSQPKHHPAATSSLARRVMDKEESWFADTFLTRLQVVIRRSLRTHAGASHSP
jgi:hypothetical protein